MKLKKAVALTLALVLVLCLAPGASAAKKFDYRIVLGSRSNFTIDTAKEQWHFYRFYGKTYSDAILVVSLETVGEEGGSNPLVTYLIAYVLNNDNEIYSPVTGISFEIGDDVYAYDEMKIEKDGSFAFLGDKGERLIEAIADCNPSEVTLKVKTEDRNFSFEVERDKFRDTLVEFCRIFTKYEIGSYRAENQELKDLEEQYPLTINGEPA